MRKERGREDAGLSGGVARMSTVDHRGKLANAESRPQNAAAPPAAAAVVVAASTLPFVAPPVFRPPPPV